MRLDPNYRPDKPEWYEFGEGDTRPSMNRRPTRENPIEYLGWFIYCWTGWKGCVGKALYIHDTDKREICHFCQKPIKQGEKVYISHAYFEYPHLKCVDWDDIIVSQWLACKPHPDINDPNMQFLYVSIPGDEGIYTRGQCFDIGVKPGQRRLTYDTSVNVLKRERDKGLERMERLIERTVKQGG
jgi:hypothetical protein